MRGLVVSAWCAKSTDSAGRVVPALVRRHRVDMSAKASASTPVPQASAPDDIRNVVLVGHSGAGKTRLFEHLIAATTPDYRAKPVVDERSVQLAVASVSHQGVVLNLIDTPGYPDFVGELRAGLRAADAALFVISAADGVDGATMLLWEECAAIGMPRAVAVTKLDCLLYTSDAADDL